MKLKILIFLLIFPYLYLNSQTIVPLKSEADIDRIKDGLNGNIFMINLWATWCKPCTEEFPGLLKLYSDFKDKGFKIIFISVDEPADTAVSVIPFLKSNNVNFTTYINDFRISDDFMNYIDKNWEGSIPMTYIYDKTGRVYKMYLGSRDYEFFRNEIENIMSGTEIKENVQSQQ